MTKTRIEIIRKKRNAMQKYFRNDIADLLKNGLDINASGRAGNNVIAGVKYSNSDIYLSLNQETSVAMNRVEGVTLFKSSKLKAANEEPDQYEDEILQGKKEYHWQLESDALFRKKHNIHVSWNNIPSPLQNFVELGLRLKRDIIFGHVEIYKESGALFSLILKDGRVGLVEDVIAVIAQVAECEESWKAFKKVSWLEVLKDLLDNSTGSSYRTKENAVSALLNLINCGGEEVPIVVCGKIEMRLLDGIIDVS
ncbi:Ubiquitin--protein ligase [Abeliophyllum distichum]|uniref:Ubiquitin--protein ligase n=1 Tax=Abeliophyllum distichum TaxID=126358 RepID=A0ABD1SC11_9LAMI